MDRADSRVHVDAIRSSLVIKVSQKEYIMASAVKEIRKTDSKGAVAATDYVPVLPVTDDESSVSELVSQLAEEVTCQLIDTNPKEDEWSRRLQQGIDGLRVLR
jgi:hypothetical protein